MSRLGFFLPFPVVLDPKTGGSGFGTGFFIRVNFRLFRFPNVVGRFLLVSPERVVRFQCGFRRLVAYSDWKTSWKFQNVGCNCWILVNFWIRTCNAKCVDKRYRSGGRFLLVAPKRVVRFQFGFRCLVAYRGWKKFWKFQNVWWNCQILVNLFQNGNG